MLEWIEKILKPFIAIAPENAIPLFMLDSYQCHIMASVISLILQLGMEVKHIHGGCTSLCQSVDVGVDRSMKKHL